MNIYISSQIIFLLQFVIIKIIKKVIFIYLFLNTDYQIIKVKIQKYQIEYRTTDKFNYFQQIEKKKKKKKKEKARHAFTLRKKIIIFLYSIKSLFKPITTTHLVPIASTHYQKRQFPFFDRTFSTLLLHIFFKYIFSYLCYIHFC